jgi:FtsH-binding integral membrane protein
LKVCSYKKDATPAGSILFCGLCGLEAEFVVNLRRRREGVIV